MSTTEEMTPDEIRKARYREYYYAHREEICRKNRERYNALDKEVRAARSRKYMREHYEEHLAASSRYQKTHREKMRAYQKQYREKNKEACTAARKKYEEEHREQIRERRRKYREAHKDEIHAKAKIYRETHKEAKKEYNWKHRYRDSQRVLNDYSFRSIESIQQQIPERVVQYIERWSFEKHAHKRILWVLSRMGISPAHHLYQECYDAGMIAYLYTIHRCAYMNYTHVEAYLLKMIPIMVRSALIVGGEVDQICMFNGYREYRLEANNLDSKRRNQ